MMKHILYILTVVFCLGITACQRHSAYPFAMQQAEALMNTRPDSALLLLESMADTLDMLPEEARMYHHLLTIQAKDKQYITHTGDSLINRIVAFYEESGDKDRLMMAYYYQGSTYRDMNDAPRALKAFQQAVDLNVPNLDLLAKTYNQMGKLFMYQGLHDEVIRVNRKAMEAYLSLGKRNKISYFQRDIARMYDMKDMPDSALHYYKEACRTALESDDSTRYYGILSELGGYYLEIKAIDPAKRILLSCKELDYIHDKTHIYSMLGHIYKNEHKDDSANYYYLKAAEQGDIHQSYRNYRYSFNVSNRTGNHAKAVGYIKKALILKDSIDKIIQTEAITKINSLYNYQHIQMENIHLQSDLNKQKILFYTLLFITLFTILISSYFSSYCKKNKKKPILHKLENDQKSQEELVMEFKKTELYKKIWSASSCEKSDSKLLNDPGFWISLQQHIDEIYPRFTERLKEINSSLSLTEFQICWLTKIGISPSGISRVLNVTKQAITNARTRLGKKLRTKEEQNVDFDQFIKNL